MSDKNLIPEICKLLGIEVGEKFKIRHNSGKNISPKTYIIDERGILKSASNEAVEVASINIAYLLNGEYEIVKLPWLPKVGEGYWTFRTIRFGKDPAWTIQDVIWNNSNCDYAAFKAGWVYHTENEAKAALLKITSELGIQYVL